MRIIPPLLLLVLTCACAAPAPRAPTPRAATRTVAPTATPNPAASALAVVPLRIQETALPPAEPTPPGITAGRATATPFATPEAAWKYVSLTFAVENRSESPWLVGVTGADPSSTNLADAVLTGPDGTKYRPVRSSTTLGLRTATSHALTTYPVLLRLPPGFRASAESGGSVSVVAPDPSLLIFKVPASLSDYGTLSIPPPAHIGPKTGEDDVSRRIRPLMGGFQPVSLSASGAQNAVFPSVAAAQLPGVGTPVTSGATTVSVLGVESADPQDFELRNRGWKQVTLTLQYASSAQPPPGLNVSAWLFGDDGVVYTGDAPFIGDFGRSLTPPEPSAIWLWDGRSAGADQSSEPRRAAFVVPRGLKSAVLVLSGDVDASFNVAF